MSAWSTFDRVLSRIYIYSGFITSIACKICRAILFFFPFSSHSRCEIERAGGGKSSISVGIWRYRVRISHGYLSFFRFPSVFNFKTVWNRTGGGTGTLEKKRSPNTKLMKTAPSGTIAINTRTRKTKTWDPTPGLQHVTTWLIVRRCTSWEKSSWHLVPMPASRFWQVNSFALDESRFVYDVALTLSRTVQISPKVRTWGWLGPCYLYISGR